MTDEEKNMLVNLTLAPYLQKATALIGKKRRVGGNQFRHAIATLGILIDYHIIDPVILKASVIHDLLEDVENSDPNDILAIDENGAEVLALVIEVTRREERKSDYLKRLKKHGSHRAKILKVADRISNLTDLNQDTFNLDFIENYIDETEEFVYPIALEVNENMAIEIKDLIERRRKLSRQREKNSKL